MRSRSKPCRTMLCIATCAMSTIAADQARAEETASLAAPEAEASVAKQSASGPALELSAALETLPSYVARGIVQPILGLIVTPHIEVSVAAYTSDAAVSAITLRLGNWNALASAEELSAPLFFESDFYAGGELQLVDALTLGATYQSAISPISAFASAHELQLAASLDDGGYFAEWGSERFVGVRPSVLFVTELRGTAMGERLGRFIAPKIEPGLVALRGSSVDLVLSAPVELGLSGGDYYETDGGESYFGYLDTAVALDLTATQRGAGTWGARATLHHLLLGEAGAESNQGSRSAFLATIGMVAEL